eukprot:SAG11_NODE_957_length_6394_cov_4.145512_2_plen_79_part_00
MHDVEVTKLDVSNQNLGPAEIMLISSAIPTTPGVVEVVISGNKCFGSNKRIIESLAEMISMPMIPTAIRMGGLHYARL